MRRPSAEAPDRVRIDSVAVFVSEMSGLLDASGKPIWFRGHSGSGWSLIPGALRDDFRQHAESVIASRPVEATPQGATPLEAAEQLMNGQFLRAAAAMLPDHNLVHAYFLAQHHGLPTRLLDWTANPLMALFVSTAERPDEDGEVTAIVVDWRLSTGSTPVPESLPTPPVSERHPLVGEAVRYLFGEGPATRQRTHRPAPSRSPVRSHAAAGRLFHAAPARIWPSARTARELPALSDSVHSETESPVGTQRHRGQLGDAVPRPGQRRPPDPPDVGRGAIACQCPATRDFRS